MSEFPLNRKETFSVSMVVFIGFFYFVSLASAFAQTQSIPLQKLVGKTEIKFLCLGVLYWYGAFSFYRLKNWGWVICTATLLNFVMVVLQFVIAISQSQRFDAFAAIILSSFLLVLMAFLFLFNKFTRIKLMVNNGSYLLVIGVYGVLLAVTFLL